MHDWPRRVFSFAFNICLQELSTQLSLIKHRERERERERRLASPDFCLFTHSQAQAQDKQLLISCFTFQILKQPTIYLEEEM